jgi:hypothetical protein
MIVLTSRSGFRRDVPIIRVTILTRGFSPVAVPLTRPQAYLISTTSKWYAVAVPQSLLCCWWSIAARMKFITTVHVLTDLGRMLHGFARLGWHVGALRKVSPCPNNHCGYRGVMIINETGSPVTIEYRRGTANLEIGVVARYPGDWGALRHRFVARVGPNEASSLYIWFDLLRSVTQMRMQCCADVAAGSDSTDRFPQSFRWYRGLAPTGLWVGLKD